MRKQIIFVLIVIFALSSVKTQSSDVLQCLVALKKPCSDSNDEDCTTAFQAYQKCKSGKEFKQDTPVSEVIDFEKSCRGNNEKVQKYSDQIIDCLGGTYLIMREDLQGYNCLDLSKVSDETLENNNTENIYKNIVLILYKCTDIDVFKTTVPNNCASNQEIEDMISGPSARFRIKMLTSQYDTVSEQIQQSYKNFFQFFTKEEQLLARFKTIKQTTLLKKGPFIQQQSSFSSPIDYILETRAFKLKDVIQAYNMSMHMYLVLSVAEQYQSIQIQYPTFMEILAICNSTIAVIMSVGFIGRYFAKQLIKEDISLLLLQNIYQPQYLKSLKALNIFQNKISDQEGTNQKNDVIENTESVFIPSFMTKSNETVGINKINIDSPKDPPQDFIVENYDEQQQQQNPINKNINFSNDLNSERSKFNIKQNNKYSTNTQSNYQQSNIQDFSPKFIESSHQINQKKRKQSEVQLLQQSNQNQLFDNQNNLITLKQLKFELLKSKQNSDLNTPNQSVQSSKKDTHQQQIIINKSIENLKAIKDVSFGNKIKNMLFKPKCCKRKIQINSTLDPNFKRSLDEEVNNNLDILQIYKDIITLKKAIMMLLSKDQYAAIQLIGCSGKYHSSLNINQDKNTEIYGKLFQGIFNQNIKIIIQKLLNQEQRMHIGHLDEQFLISQSLSKQEDYINIFLQR